jgi:ADP-L-glycero-D-manno-heptose 6-epimerase
MSLSNKNILITGGAGFIGSNLAHHIQNSYQDTNIVVVDIFRSENRFSNGNLKSFGHYENLIGFHGEVISGDINNKELIDSLKQYDFDYIFHQAAISDTTVKDQGIMIKTNVNAFKSILDLAIHSNANIVYASSAATYGDAPSPQKVGVESPNNVYGFSKLMMDNLARKYKKNSSISIVGLRYFNVYGEGEYRKNKTASTILQFGLQILGGNAPKLFEGSDKIYRDFVYIKDVLEANIKACNPKKSGIYNVGFGTPRSFQDIADILQKTLKTEYKTEYIPNPYIGSYQFHTQADIKESEEFLGYTPKWGLEDAIDDYIEKIKTIYTNFTCK